MAQTDIVTFAPIIFWSFLIIIPSYLYIYSFLYPTYINNFKILYKIKNNTVFTNKININKITIIEKFPLFKKFKNLLKTNI